MSKPWWLKQCARLRAGIPALLLPVVCLWAGAASGGPSLLEAGPRRAASSSALAEDPNNARVIVKYRAGTSLMRSIASASRATGSGAVRPQHALALASRLGLPLTDGRVLGERSQALRGRGLSSSQLAQRLAAQADVEWAVVDQRRSISGVLPNDPLFGAGLTSTTPAVGQWYLRAPDATAVSATNAVGAWAVSTGSASITVAVVDTGVLFDHPDLAGKLWPGYDFIANSGSVANSGDGNGRDADATDPGDWTTSSDSCGASSSSWHGTQVSGLIAAASDNGTGMAGLARNVMVLPVRVLGQCGGYDSDIVAGMRWAAGLSNDSSCTAASARSETCNPHVAQVINLSLGSTGSCLSASNALYREAVPEIVAAGATVVVAAGNSEGLAVGVPANCPGALAVAGLRHAGTKVGYSNVGPEVALAAPAGNCINTSGACLYPLLTTTNSGSTSAGAHTYSDSSNYSVGTSFAAPLVAGTAALMLSVDPTLTPAQVKALLQASARGFPTTGAQTVGAVACHAPNGRVQDECYCTSTTCGAGMLDAAAAVLATQAQAVPPPTAQISASASTLVAGSTLTLDGSGSSAASGASITGYQWAITGGAAAASLQGATTGSTVTVSGTGAGSATVTLTVTDSHGRTGRSSLSLSVTAAPVASAPVSPVSSGSGGGGGGALGLGWLAGLALAVWALRRPAQRDSAGG